MLPFGWARDEDNSVVEKELDRIAEEGVKIVKAGYTHRASGAEPTAEPETAFEPTTTVKPVQVPVRLTLDPVKGNRFLAEVHVSEKGVKSILLGNGTKHGRLVFHDRAELVEWLNEARANIGVESVSLADLHFHD